MTEQFVDIEGYETHFQISNYGRVYSLNTNKFLKIQVTKKGYQRITLSLNKKYSSFSIHRLVMYHFLGKSSLEINHKDGNKLNNRIDNLEYCTAKDNTRHAWNIGLCTPIRGENQGNSKLKNIDILKIRELIKIKLSDNKIAILFNVSSKTIFNIRHNKIWRHIK